MMRLSRGRVVPATTAYTKRIEQAMEVYAEHKEAVDTLVAQFPERLLLEDGRILRVIERNPYNVKYLGSDGMAVIASYDATPHGILLHISTSYRQSDPTWHDLKILRASFFPSDVDVIQVLPRAGEFVNIHEHCFHLFQAPEVWQGGLFV